MEPRFILNYLRSNFSIGLRLFILDTYSHKLAEKQLESEYLSIGPIASIEVSIWNRINMIVRGYYEFITNTNVPDKEQASLIMQLNWKF